MNQKPSRRGEVRAFDRPAFGVAGVLLAFALTHCGGKAGGGQPESGGASVAGQNSAATSAGGGSSSGGSAGTGTPWIEVPAITSAAGSSAGSECNTVDEGDKSDAAVIAGDPPKPEGGTITNGLFHLTRHEVYVGRNGNTDRSVSRARSSLLISGSTGATADLQFTWLESTGELPRPFKQSQTLVVSGTSYTYTVTCSSELAFAQGGSLSFTATAGELIWIQSASDGATYVDTFERK